MNIDQIRKLCNVGLIGLVLMLVSDILFGLHIVTDTINNLITTQSLIGVYVVLGILMFLQVTVLPIPALVVLTAVVKLNLPFIPIIIVTMIGYMLGALLAYYLGYKFGRKAVEWVAGSEEEYNQWADFINKKGKLFYLFTILLPVFPDDLLCIVAGAVKFNFTLYTVFNLIGRLIGLIVMLLTLNLVSGSGITMYLYIAGIIILFIFKIGIDRKSKV